MEDDTSSERDPNRGGVKRPYARPTLTFLGSVKELTGTPGTVMATEPIFAATPKTQP